MGGCQKGDWTGGRGGVANWRGPCGIFEGFVLCAVFMVELVSFKAEII